MNQKKLTQGNVASILIGLTLPIIWGVFAVMSLYLADTYFVAQLGTDDLAAISFIFPVAIAVQSVALGLGMGASSVIARAIGVGDRHKVQQLTTNSLILSLAIVGVLIIIGQSTIDPLFAALGASERVLPLIRDYMQIWYPGMIFLVVPVVGNNAIRAAGNAIVPSLILTIGVVVNIVLDPLFIFGWGGFPSLGIQGAAIATVIARATGLPISLMFLHYRQQMLLLAVPNWQEVLNCWKSVLHIGLSATATQIIAPISVGFMTRLIAGSGSEAVAGFGIASRIESFPLVFLTALSLSMGPFVGQNWGAKKFARVKRALQLSIMFCLVWGTLVAIALGFSGGWIASQFNSHPDVVAIAAQYLTIVPISYTTLGIVLISSSTFNALGKPLPSLVINLTRMLILYVPLAYLGSRVFGVLGIFTAICFSNLAVGIGAFFWTRNTYQKMLCYK